MNGPTILVGRACDGDPIPPAPRVTFKPGEELIALVESGKCRYDEKIANVVGAGYGGAVVFKQEKNAEKLINMGGDDTLGTIPAVSVNRFTGFAILGIDPASPADTPLPPLGTPGEHITADGVFDGWDMRGS